LDVRYGQRKNDFDGYIPRRRGAKDRRKCLKENDWIIAGTKTFGPIIIVSPENQRWVQRGSFMRASLISKPKGTWIFLSVKLYLVSVLK
jgi:hypothetical protein